MASALGPILAVTIVVPDLRRATLAYRALLGVEELAAGSENGRRWVVLGPSSAQWGLLRVVEEPDAISPPAFRTLGWNALEILVGDADAMFERCLTIDGFEVLQRPATVGTGGGLRALQATGPGGEGVYLTQIVRPSERFSLPDLATGEHRVYVVAVGTHDVQSTRTFFEATFGAPMVTDHGLPVKVLNQAYGLPYETQHRISTVQLAGQTVIEIDEYPPQAVARPPASSGITSVTFAGAPPPGTIAHELPKRSEPPFSSAQAWKVMGPFGLPFELVEIDVAARIPQS